MTLLIIIGCCFGYVIIGTCVSALVLALEPVTEPDEQIKIALIVVGIWPLVAIFAIFYKLWAVLYKKFGGT